MPETAADDVYGRQQGQPGKEQREVVEVELALQLAPEQEGPRHLDRSIACDG